MSTDKPSLPPDIQLALQRGDVLGAIRAIRAAGGIDLQAAKRMLEQQAGAGHHRLDEAKASLQASAETARDTMRSAALRIQQHSRPPTVVMGDRPGDMRWVLIVAALLAAAVWLAFGGA